MPPKRKHDVWIISSEDDDEKPPAKKGTQRISNKMVVQPSYHLLALVLVDGRTSCAH